MQNTAKRKAKSRTFLIEKPSRLCGKTAFLTVNCGFYYLKKSYFMHSFVVFWLKTLSVRWLRLHTFIDRIFVRPEFVSK